MEYKLRKTIIVVFCLFALCSFAFAEKTYWWDNPHRDDKEAMYERGKASGARRSGTHRASFRDGDDRIEVIASTYKQTAEGARL